MRCVVAALIAFVSMAGLQAQSTPTPEALARALQERYRTINDFSADFTQTYRGAALKTQTREQGTVAIKKPGRMRWVYAGKDPKEFVSDGTTVYTYLPSEKQVIVAKLPADDHASTPALFLAGKGDIARDFTVALAATPLPGTVALKLTPRRKEPDYEYFVVILDPATLQIRGLVTRDRQGGESTMTFTKLKENQRISDKNFEFRIPRGVDVVTSE